MIPTIVPAYAALLALIFIFLSLKVIRLRQSLRVGIGAGGKPALERAIRIHGNFAEYIPLALLLLLFMELQGRAHWLIYILCLALIVARLVHAYGVGQENEDIRLRKSAVTTTFVIIGIAALSALGHAL